MNTLDIESIEVHRSDSGEFVNDDEDDDDDIEEENEQYNEIGDKTYSGYIKDDFVCSDDEIVKVKKRHKNKIKIKRAKPIRRPMRNYKWKELYSTTDGGVYARIYLKPGVIIPILGIFRQYIPKIIKKKYIYQNKKIIYSCEEDEIYENIPDWGLGVYYKMNTSDRPNCVIWNDYIMTIDSIQRNEELLLPNGDNRDYGLYNKIIKCISLNKIKRLNVKLTNKLIKLEKRYLSEHNIN